MKYSSFLLALPLVLLCACASSEPELDVSVYKLKDTKSYSRENPVARGEQQKRLRGAVTGVDRRARLGGYYTIDWDRGKEYDSTAPVRVVFLYRQAATASKVHRLQKDYPASTRKAVTEFSVIGEQYAQNGRVLNWRCEVYSGEELMAHEQSYMWH